MVYIISFNFQFHLSIVFLRDLSYVLCYFYQYFTVYALEQRNTYNIPPSVSRLRWLDKRTSDGIDDLDPPKIISQVGQYILRANLHYPYLWFIFGSLGQKLISERSPQIYFEEPFFWALGTGHVSEVLFFGTSTHENNFTEATKFYAKNYNSLP